MNDQRICETDWAWTCRWGLVFTTPFWPCFCRFILLNELFNIFSIPSPVLLFLFCLWSLFFIFVCLLLLSYSVLLFSLTLLSSWLLLPSSWGDPMQWTASLNPSTYFSFASCIWVSIFDMILPLHSCVEFRQQQHTQKEVIVKVG